jgi:hypothetical protein
MCRLTLRNADFKMNVDSLQRWSRLISLASFPPLASTAAKQTVQAQYAARVGKEKDHQGDAPQVK